MATATLAHPTKQALACQVNFEHDPLKGFADWVERTQDIGPLNIRFDDRLTCEGKTVIGPDGQAHIELNAKVTLRKLTDALIHQMAHVLLWKRGLPWKHCGPECFRTYRILGDAWLATVEKEAR